jgi:hypothetical protein
MVAPKFDFLAPEAAANLAAGAGPGSFDEAVADQSTGG